MPSYFSNSPNTSHRKISETPIFQIPAIAQVAKDPASRRGSSGSNHGGNRTVGFVNAEGTDDVKALSGIVQLMSNLHHNAAAVVTSKVKSISVLK